MELCWQLSKVLCWHGASWTNRKKNILAAVSYLEAEALCLSLQVDAPMVWMSKYWIALFLSYCIQKAWPLTCWSEAFSYVLVQCQEGTGVETVMILVKQPLIWEALWGNLPQNLKSVILQREILFTNGKHWRQCWKEWTSLPILQKLAC